MKLINVIQHPDNYTIYLKPDNCLLRNNEDFYLPTFSDHITARLALVIRIKKIGKKVAEKFGTRYYDEISVGLNLEAADVLNEIKQQGLPWDRATSFDSSAPIGTFTTRDDNAIISLHQQNEVIQEIPITDFHINTIISKISHQFTLKIGDLVYISLPEENIHLNTDQHLTAFINQEAKLSCTIK